MSTDHRYAEDIKNLQIAFVGLIDEMEDLKDSINRRAEIRKIEKQLGPPPGQSGLEGLESLGSPPGQSGLEGLESLGSPPGQSGLESLESLSIGKFQSLKTYIHTSWS